jgi:hypothetical protein
METGSNLLTDDVEDILERVLSAVDDELLVVNPTIETIEALVTVASVDDDHPTIRMLAEEGLLKDVMDDFIVASNAADLVSAERLEIRTLAETDGENALLVTPDSVMALVAAGEMVAALATDDDEFVATTNETYLSRFEEARPFNLRTPPLTQVRTTLSDEIGDSTRTDFDSVLTSLKTARGDGDGLDEVTISLLVAAKNEVLLYDISKWGEDVGIASKATFSRTKTKLEDMGLIDTEKVPIDVGRPRLRLKLGDERLRDAGTDELASVAQSLLAS